MEPEPRMPAALLLDAVRRLGALPAVALALLCGGLVACDAGNNRAPTLLPLADQVPKVNVPTEIAVFAEDRDGDSLTFSFALTPEPPSLTQSQSGHPNIARINAGQAVFLWTPGIADAGPDDQMAYELTFTVKDGNGGKASESVQIRVVNEGLGPVGLVFMEPPGAGMAVDLSQTPCIQNLAVSVKADLVQDADVELRLGDPVPSGATLTPDGNGKTKTLAWCPSDADLDSSLSHTLVFEARRVNDDQPVTKRFLVRFKRNAGANCPGSPPTIDHTSPGQQSGPLNYSVVATIVDDVGFKSLPILAFTTDAVDRAGPVDTSGWQVVEMTEGANGQYTAAIPNLNLADGERATISYVITATDNDDPDGTHCDHSVESPLYQFDAVGGGQASGQTYGDCAPCVADAQCGGDNDNCVPLLGEHFCAHACEGGCGAGTACVQLTSIDGVTAFQCVPQDANCGQICTADAFEANGGNNDVPVATPVTPGTYADLTICDRDVDVFSVPVEAMQSVTVSIDFENAVGDLDLFMALPGDGDEFPYQSANGNLDQERVTEPCVPEGGMANVVVTGYQDARNRYTLTIETGPGDCNQVCADDRFDAQPPGNDIIDDFTLVETFPYSQNGLVICRQNPDFFGFDARAGEVVRAGIAFSHQAGDLDLRLFRSTGEPVAESLSYRDVELIELAVPADDIYVLEIFGATRSVSNVYDLTIEKLAQQGCQVTLQCPAGEYCNAGQCVNAQCDRPRGCGVGAQCVAPMVGEDPVNFGGTCADDCASPFECRTELGYACKRFEDFTSGCLPAGAGRTGDRCQGHSDCEDTDVCFPLPGGYCASGGCPDVDCPPGTLCANVPGMGEVQACLKACAGPEDCRAGYSCQNVFGGSACLP